MLYYHAENTLFIFFQNADILFQWSSSVHANCIDGASTICDSKVHCMCALAPTTKVIRPLHVAMSWQAMVVMTFKSSKTEYIKGIKMCIYLVVQSISFNFRTFICAADTLLPQQPDVKVLYLGMPEGWFIDFQTIMPDTRARQLCIKPNYAVWMYNRPIRAF